MGSRHGPAVSYRMQICAPLLAQEPEKQCQVWFFTITERLILKYNNSHNTISADLTLDSPVHFTFFKEQNWFDSKGISSPTPVSK